MFFLLFFKSKIANNSSQMDLLFRRTHLKRLEIIMLKIKKKSCGAHHSKLRKKSDLPCRKYN